jgi:hypothetical protein
MRELSMITADARLRPLEWHARGSGVGSIVLDVASNSEVLHVFTVDSGLIAAMELGEEADPTAGPSAAFTHRS